VFESGLQHLADRPSAYLSQPDEVKNFFRNLPVAWDNTKLLSGYPADHVVMARQKGDTWYIGGLNGTNEQRNLPMNLSFLKNKNYVITLFRDDQKERSFEITKEKLSNKKMSISCLPRGGFVAVITSK
jgi:Glycoside hydrolase 97.